MSCSDDVCSERQHYWDSLWKNDARPASGVPQIGILIIFLLVVNFLSIESFSINARVVTIYSKEHILHNMFCEKKKKWKIVLISSDSVVFFFSFLFQDRYLPGSNFSFMFGKHYRRSYIF